MQVSFTKTDHRRYGVYVHRQKAEDLWMYGPGYSDELPHDLLHFVAEAEWGLDGGVFGDVASGGNARTFQPLDQAHVAKLWRAQRIKKHSLPDGRRSEELAAILGELWRERQGRPLSDWFEERRGELELDDSLVERALDRLDELAQRWQALKPAESITLEWPRPEGRKKHPPRERYSKRSRQTRSPSRQ